MHCAVLFVYEFCSLSTFIKVMPYKGLRLVSIKTCFQIKSDANTMPRLLCPLHSVGVFTQNNESVVVHIPYYQFIILKVPCLFTNKRPPTWPMPNHEAKPQCRRAPVSLQILTLLRSPDIYPFSVIAKIATTIHAIELSLFST